MTQANRRTFVQRLFAFFAGLMIAGNALAQGAAAPVTSTVPAIEPADTWYLELSTGGRVAIQLRPDKAPNHVERIKALTRRHFYDGIIFHRVIEGFMAQTGDPTGSGTGGSDLPDLKAEFNNLPHVRGAVSMARAESEDSANSQFFIMLQPVLRIDGRYTVFGRVVSGMQYVDAIERGEPPANPSKIVRAYLGDAMPADAAAPPPVAAGASGVGAATQPKLSVDGEVARQPEPATGAETPADPQGD